MNSQLFSEEQNRVYNSDAKLGKEPQCNQKKYRQRANLIFEKLQNLEAYTETAKFNKHKTVLKQIDNTEQKINDNIKIKESSFAKIVQIVSELEKELQEQHNHQQKFRRELELLLNSTQRDFTQKMDNMESQKTKMQADLERVLDMKIQSVILKNKYLWKEGPLFNSEIFIEEISHLKFETEKFYQMVDRQLNKIKKQFKNALKDQRKLLMEETDQSQRDEEQSISLMRTLKVEFNTKIEKMKHQRVVMQECALGTMEKILAKFYQQAVDL